jgi:glutamine synthetase
MEKKDKQYVLEMAKKHNVKFIWLWFTDILGFLKSFAITVEELENAIDEGMGFDGSSIATTRDQYRSKNVL